MKTALLVGGQLNVVIVSPAAARSLGFLDPATETVLPAYRPREPNNFFEAISRVGSDGHKTIEEFHFSIAGREQKLVAVVEEIPRTGLAGEEYIVLPYFQVQGFISENIVHRKVIK